MKDKKYYVECLDCDSKIEITILDDEYEIEPSWCPVCGSNDLRENEIDEN